MYSDDMYVDNFNNYNQNKVKNLFKVNKKIIILIIFVLLILTGIYLYYKNTAYLNSYEYLEETLENEARKYVSSNGIKNNQEYYIESSKLGVTLKSDCFNLSGVLVNGNDYQAYLVCENYESKLFENNNDNIKLNGKEVMFLNKGNTYSEPYYENENKLKVNINGNIGSEEGVYNLEYVVMQYDMIVSRLKRKIIVLNNKMVEDFYPQITLLGEKIEYLEINNMYTDKGVVAKDRIDGVINDVKVSGDVNSKVSGEYNLIYTVINSRGYASSVERKVVVARPAEKTTVSSIMTPTKLTNSNVNIILSVYGSNYLHTKLPNGEITYKKTFEYIASDNGKYDFLICDNDETCITESISIENIKREPPKGSCNALVDFDHTDVTVVATSDVGISGYKYIVNDIETDYISSFNYRANSNDIKTVKVKVKDIVGNVAEMECIVKLLDPTIGNPNVKYYTKFGKTYVIPKTENNLDDFVWYTNGKIAQYVDRTNCRDACLSFAYYHSYYLQFGHMESMNMYDACHYGGVPIGFQRIIRTNKQDIFDIIMEEIRRGRVIVLQVKGGSGRHYVTVVGYKRSVFHSSKMTDDDLLIIDSWDGNLKSVEGSNRQLYYETNQKRDQGYMVYKMSR